MAKILLSSRLYRINENGRLARIRDNKQPEIDPHYERYITQEISMLHKKYFADQDDYKLIYKEFIDQLKYNKISFKYQKINKIVSFFHDGRYRYIYYTRSGYFRIILSDASDPNDRLCKVYFKCEDLQGFLDKLVRYKIIDWVLYRKLGGV